MRLTSLVLLSGGLDSSLSFERARKDTDILYAVTFDYGQRSAAQEIRAAQGICAHFDIAHKVVELRLPGFLADHPLLNQAASLPQPTEKQLDDPGFSQQSAKTVWVPNRNGIFVNVAAGLAEAGLATRIYVGFNAEEAATFPDNSESYLKAANKALSYSTLNQTQVIAPTIAMKKPEILAELVKCDFPLNLIWSCYQGANRMCGVCESCQRLARAARLAKIDEQIFFTDRTS